MCTSEGSEPDFLAPTGSLPVGAEGSRGRLDCTLQASLAWQPRLADLVCGCGCATWGTSLSLGLPIQDMGTVVSVSEGGHKCG